MSGRTSIWIADPPFLWTATFLLAASAISFLIWPLSTFHIAIQSRTIALATIGALAGLHGASYGAYKDSPHESFLARRFLRELVIALGIAFFLASMSASASQCFFILFLTIFTLTRVVTEFWKLFVRVEPQQDFRIPTQFHYVRGVVNRRWLRLLAGAGFLASIYGMYCLFTLLPHGLPNLVRGLMVGAGFGLTEAIAGAYKDGTIEGFSTVKFLKSPVFCAIGGFIAAFHTQHLGFLMLAAYGTNRMMLELFFKILAPGYAPGKFRSMTGSFTEWTERRTYFLLPYGVTWLFWLGLLLQ
ncbi:MAG: hypothetical protein HY820_38335 [Acidobacteria bacterium]|nr:hypothetical protein [Acidobacteriota bacterium]